MSNCLKLLGMIAFIAIVPISMLAQQATLTGQVVDDKGLPLVGSSILFEGSSKGTMADIDGNYTINNIEPGTYVINFSFIGFRPQSKSVTFAAGQTVTQNITLETDAMLLKESVVIGYGTVNSEDLTGSTKVVTAKDFSSGNVTTPEQLISGKVSGVQITQNDGAPGSGSRIRIRGGTSINASNDPLIVIDGVPLDNEGISGSANPLNLINPNDIESFVVLKDASAAAIYGSRGANGVILITTKRGSAEGAPLSINIQQGLSLGQVTRTVDMMTASELQAAIEEHGTEDQLALLGTADTDWQNEVFRNSFISETNLGITGGVKRIPYRLSLGYKMEQGVLDLHKLNRTAVGLNLSPKFLQDHLSVEVNTKFSHTDNVFADQGSIGSAVSFDPTQTPLTDSDEYGGYYEWLNPNTGLPNILAGRNPLGLLYQKDDFSDVNRFIGNVKADLELPFYPELHAVINVGTDIANSSGTVDIPAEAASQFVNGGESRYYEATKSNRLLETYINYKKSYEELRSDVDFTAGYSFQHWERENPAFPTLNQDGDTITPAGIPFHTENILISFYGRLLYDFDDRFLLTTTLRRDGSSRFAPENRWGLFPSAALAWRVTEEKFMENVDIVSYLKVRGGYGITGQQDIGNDYPYLANYQTSTPTAYYQLGDEFYSLLRPDGFDYNIKWEETTSTNIGIDFGFANDRVFGSFDYYIKNTDDLLAIVDVPAGANFKNEILTNVGSMTNKGFEVELSVVAVSKEETELTVGANLTMNRNEITKLTQVQDSSSIGILVGGINGGIGNNIQIHAVGSPTNSFYVYEQAYDASGNPIEGEFVDRNGDGVLNEQDRYIHEKPAPDAFVGFYTNLTHKKWSAGFNVRAELGRYVYNNVVSERGWFNSIPAENHINNLHSAFNTTQFITSSPEQFLSDYYLEKANFFRMDYLNIGYNFGQVLNQRAMLNVGFVCNNVFVLSQYSGIDPEITNGIDKNIYPRPRIYSLRVNLTL